MKSTGWDRTLSVRCQHISQRLGSKLMAVTYTGSRIEIFHDSGGYTPMLANLAATDRDLVDELVNLFHSTLVGLEFGLEINACLVPCLTLFLGQFADPAGGD